jgi:hypothetical protein
MHYFTKRNVVDIAVNKLCARGITQRFSYKSANRLVVTTPAFAQIKIRRVAGSMRQQQVDCDAISSTVFNFRDVG